MPWWIARVRTGSTELLYEEPIPPPWTWVFVPWGWPTNLWRPKPHHFSNEGQIHVTSYTYIMNISYQSSITRSENILRNGMLHNTQRDGTFYEHVISARPTLLLDGWDFLPLGTFFLLVIFLFSLLPLVPYFFSHTMHSCTCSWCMPLNHYFLYFHVDATINIIS